MSETAGTAPSTHCPYCGMTHSMLSKCPMVKAYEYHTDGTVKRVEFFAPNDYTPLMVYGPRGTEIEFPPMRIT